MEASGGEEDGETGVIVTSVECGGAEEAEEVAEEEREVSGVTCFVANLSPDFAFSSTTNLNCLGQGIVIVNIEHTPIADETVNVPPNCFVKKYAFVRP